MPQIPQKINPNLTGSPVQVINKVREYATTDYKNAVPYATSDASVLRQIGAILSDTPVLFNEFANVLYNQIGFVWFSSNLFWKNPWTFAERGVLELGEVVQEIYVGLCKPYKYDPAVAETHWMKREVPDVHTAFHPVNYKFFYKSTIQRDSLAAAFTSVGALDKFIQEVIGQMMLSAEYDQFHSLMYLYAISVFNGLIPAIEVPDADSADDMKEIATALRSASNKMTFLSPKYTISGVRAATPKNQQHLIISSDFEAEFDVEVLASAFNMDKADYLGNRVISPGFKEMDVDRLDKLFGYQTFNESTGLWEVTPDKADVGYHHFTAEELEALDQCYALLADEEFFQCYTRLTRSTTSPENGEGLYVNNWYHVWKTLGVSPFKNAVVFIGATQAVTGVVLNTNAVTLGAGASINLDATVSTTGYASKSVVWTTEDATIATVDDGGLVTVLPTAVPGSTVNITATSVVNSAQSATCVVTVPVV